MSGESEIQLMVVVMLFSPIILLGTMAGCNALFQRMKEVELHGRHHHHRVAWSMHHRS